MKITLQDNRGVKFSDIDFGELFATKAGKKYMMKVENAGGEGNAVWLENGSMYVFPQNELIIPLKGEMNVWY